MDYKELIEQLRKHHQAWAAYSDLELAHDLEDAITAIETLLDERDAAVEDLRGLCWCCAHGKKYENGLPWSKATTCEHMRELGVVARSSGKCKCKFWQWRDPQKGDGYD